MSLHSVPPVSLDFLASRPVEIEVSSSPLSSDAGLLLIRQFDERIHLTEQFAAALQDTRNPSLARQSIATMVRQRIFGILADYEDQNDHDTLRSDPVFKLLAGRLPTALTSRVSQRSRFENAVSIADLWRLRDVMVDLFIQSFDRPPNHLTFDIDAFDDPHMASNNSLCFMATMNRISICQLP
ncbi:transposase [Singulisphaera sp. Ch08]|uniref:Transposase n=1 Tax=Singulisphaera sp. Ch08 TaxID=3120278 RepID=A0AAU7CSG1_9BACT